MCEPPFEPSSSNFLNFHLYTSRLHPREERLTLNPLILQRKKREKRNNAFPRTRYTIQIFSVYVFIHTSPYKVADLITRLSEKRIHMHLLDPADKRRRIPKSYLHADVHVITELEYGSVWKAGDALKSA